MADTAVHVFVNHPLPSTVLQAGRAGTGTVARGLAMRGLAATGLDKSTALIVRSTSSAAVPLAIRSGLVLPSPFGCPPPSL